MSQTMINAIESENARFLELTADELAGIKGGFPGFVVETALFMAGASVGYAIASLIQRPN